MSNKKANMKNLKNSVLLTIIFFTCSCSNSEENTSIAAIYFPPNNSNTWETKTLTELGWNQNNLQPLLDYLELKNTKSFIILHNGKIVVENYFGAHTTATPWYWASAGKTLTSTVAGIAEQEGLININNKVSDYLGTGWTSAPIANENLITCKNLLSMNSGLDSAQGSGVSPENLQYIANAGTRWAYRNVYVKMQDVVAQASGQTWDAYFKTKLKDKIGMTGYWNQVEALSIYSSNTRSMARFGLMIFANGKWNSTQIINQNYLTAATNTSQNINQAYGYLWWLNGKSSYQLPSSQIEFSGKLIPNAPNDMYAALGKNDQKMYIVPSKKIVIIRMGNSADGSSFGLSDFDNVLWEKINAVIN
jgi:CubicO group peptidase (beta-lactamase class C family)